MDSKSGDIASTWEVRSREPDYFEEPIVGVKWMYSIFRAKLLRLRGYQQEDIYLKVTNGGHNSVKNCTDWYTEADKNKLMSDKYGQIQFKFLKQKGLQPTDDVLEIGCGFLRCGVRVIDYLDAGNYTGMDISSSAVEEACRVVHEYELDNKEPIIFQNDDLSFDDEELYGNMFDYIFSYSVFTHLPPDRIENLFYNMSKVLKPGCGVHYSSYSKIEDNGYIMQNDAFGRGFRYPHQFFKELGDEYGFQVNSIDFNENPKDNDIIEIIRNPGSSTQ